MKTKLVRIGNSRGVRLPKPMIEEARLADEVDVHVRDGAVIITSINDARAGWAEAAKLLHDRSQDKLLDPETETRFDSDEWKW
jgi:antitoxin MazE